MDECHCGSGLDRWVLEDAAGIFCGYVCDQCVEERRSHYRPEIFDCDSRYARTGDEKDIGGDW